MSNLILRYLILSLRMLMSCLLISIYFNVVSHISNLKDTILHCYSFQDRSTIYRYCYHSFPFPFVRGIQGVSVSSHECDNSNCRLAISQKKNMSFCFAKPTLNVCVTLLFSTFQLLHFIFDSKVSN